MSNLTIIPQQDGYKTSLAQSWDGEIGTMTLQSSPSFTMPVGETCYVVIQPNGENPKIAEFDSIDTGNNTINITNITLFKGASLPNPTGVTYPTNTEVIISDNYQFWVDIKETILTKLNSDETSTVANNIKIQFGGANCYIFTDDSGVNLKFKDSSNAESTLSDILAAAGVDRKIAITDDDTTPGQLDVKLLTGDGIANVINNPSGDENIEISVDLTDSTIFASTTQKGISERATDAEYATGTDDTRYITTKQVRDNNIYPGTATTFFSVLATEVPSGGTTYPYTALASGTYLVRLNVTGDNSGSSGDFSIKVDNANVGLWDGNNLNRMFSVGASANSDEYYHITIGKGQTITLTVGADPDQPIINNYTIQGQ